MLNLQYFLNKSHSIKILLYIILAITLTTIIFYFKLPSKLVSSINGQSSNTDILTFDLPLRNKTFTGREQAFKQIKNKLSMSNIGIITQSIMGAGGIGKTQLALEYAYRAISNKEYDHILWVGAETSNSINYSYNSFARKLNIDTHGLKPHMVKKLVHHELSNKNNTQTLIILDNVPKKGTIQDYLGKLKEQWGANSTKPHILITSRNQNWDKDFLILDIFSPQEAYEFAKKYLPHEKDENIYRLNKLLYNFPLALGQALGYIKQNTNIDDFIRLYSSNQKRYLDILQEYSNQYQETLWKIFSVTLQKLSKESKEILSISAYINPDNIQTALFEIYPEEIKQKAIADLQSYSLIRMNNNQSFKIHRLSQEVIRLSINKSYWLDKTIKQALTAADNFDNSKKETWIKPRLWLSHILILSNYIQKEIDTFNVLNSYGEIAKHFGLFSLSKKMHLSVLNIKEEFYSSAYHLALGETLNALGVAEWRLGEYDLAKNHCQRALEIYKTAYKDDPNNISISKVLHTLGRISALTGNYLESLPLYERSLYINKVHFNNDQDISYSVILKDYSYAQCRCGYLEKSNIAAKQALEITRNYYKDPEHIAVAHMYQVFGITEFSLGKFVRARDIFQQALDIKEKHYKDPKNLALSYTLQTLGLSEYTLGNYYKARTLFNRALKIKKYHYQNPNHIRAAVTLDSLGLLEETLGNYEKAIKLKNHAYTIWKNNYKQKLRSALAHRTLPPSLAWLKISKKNVEQSIQYYQSILEINKNIFGEEHHETAKYYYMLGQAYEVNSQSKHAKQNYQRALSIVRNLTKNTNANMNHYETNIALLQAKLDNIITT